MQKNSTFLDIIQFLCYDAGIFYIVCRNLYEIEGERTMLQIRYTDIRNKAAATAEAVSLPMPVTPPMQS